MIVSHKYRFIFLKTAKTAGTSIEIALSKFLGEDDIVTPISAEDELIRRQFGFAGPRNHKVPLKQLSVSDLVNSAIRFRRTQFYNHMSAQEVRAYVGETVWNSYHKFCFERNPFDRVVSLFYWCFRAEPRPTLKEFVATDQIGLLTRRGIDLYTTATGALAVDQVARYENLTEELEIIRLQLGIPEPLELPRAKASHRVDRRHYSELLDDDCRALIAVRFHREMQMFGYQF